MVKKNSMIYGVGVFLLIVSICMACHKDADNKGLHKSKIAEVIYAIIIKTFNKV